MPTSSKNKSKKAAISPLAGKKILIAEDERPIARALQLKLTSSGFVVELAEDGEQALEKLSKDRFDLMLLDLMMPKKDGFAVLTELKQRGNSMPIIVSSNLSQEEDTRRASALGAKDYFVKSDVPIVSVVEKIKALLSAS